MTRLLVTLAAAATLSACATTGPVRSVDARDQLALDRELAGRVAGKPRTCLSLLDTRDSATYNGTTLYRAGRVVYRQDFGGCPELTWNVIPVFDVRGAQICQGDIVRLSDRGTGMFAGSCAVGPFVPYTKPK